MAELRIDKRLCVVFKPLADVGAADVVDADADPVFAQVAARRRLAADEHRASMARVREVLSRVRAARLDFTDDADRDADVVADADLILTVGGDGTFLAGARRARAGALLGVNSSPGTSVGHYCTATADGLDAALAAVAAEALPIASLTRIAVDVGGAPLPVLALNDVLVACRSPAQSTQYALTVGDRTELQLSSGVWIATTSGSTAAIHSAGGDVMAPDDRRLQFLVREPYTPHAGGPTLLRGYVADAIVMVSRSDRNAIFLDGHPIAYSFPRGTRAALRPASLPLRVYGYRPRPLTGV